jgi:hypothetical protein
MYLHNSGLFAIWKRSNERSLSELLQISYANIFKPSIVEMEAHL